MCGGESESVRIGDGVAWTVGPTRVITMDLSHPGARPFVLETTAAVVWEELAEAPIRPDDLVLRVATAFDVEAESIRGSIATLLGELESRSLVVRYPHASAGRDHTTHSSGRGA